MKSPLRRNLKPGEVLFEEGHISLSMFLIKSGKLSVYKVLNGKAMELSQVGRGGLVGEMSFFDNQRRTACVRALTTVDLVELPYNSLHEEFEIAPKWLKIMIKTIVTNLKNANRRLNDLQQEKSES